MSSSQPNSSSPPADALPHESTTWTVRDRDSWDAHAGPLHIGTVDFTVRYEVRLRSGEVIGRHRSLESAKAQLEAWTRWNAGVRPWTPTLVD
jgi:hypothetical protein